MKIEKYKYLGNGRYKVFIDKNDYIIFEDIILKYKILGKDNITKEELSKYLKENTFYEGYYKATSYINIKLRTKKEIEQYLSKNDFDSKVITKIIDKLTKDGYLNENIYTEAYINDQINLKIIGPLKIENDLIKLGIDKNIINKHLNCYTKEMQYEKIRKVIDKEIRLNKNKSSEMLKNKILMGLINKGFYRNDIILILDEFEIDDKDIYEKEYQKLYNKLSKKYSGQVLEYKIKEKLYQKGFRK